MDKSIVAVLSISFYATTCLKALQFQSNLLGRDNERMTRFCLPSPEVDYKASLHLQP